MHASEIVVDGSAVTDEAPTAVDIPSLSAAIRSSDVATVNHNLWKSQR